METTESVSHEFNWRRLALSVGGTVLELESQDEQNEKNELSARILSPAMHTVLSPQVWTIPALNYERK